MVSRRPNSRDILFDKNSNILSSSILDKSGGNLFSRITNFEKFCGNRFSQKDSFGGQIRNLMSRILPKFTKFSKFSSRINLSLKVVQNDVINDVFGQNQVMLSKQNLPDCSSAYVQKLYSS